MIKKNVLALGCVLIILNLFLLSCENLNPTQNQTETALLTQGVSLDQIDVVEWTPQAIATIRATPETDESNMLAKSKDKMQGCDIKEVHFDHTETIGGDITFGNSVRIPAGTVDQDRFIAVQVVCADADDQALYEDGASNIETIETGLSVLVIDVADNPTAALKAASALEKVQEAEVYFQLYSYYASDKAFNKLEKDVTKKMSDLVQMIDVGSLDNSFFDQIKDITVLTVETARELALTSIIYAQSLPGADTHKINQAIDKLDEGDIQAETPDILEENWYRYAPAVKKYGDAWKKATQALRHLDAPCGAQVDFLPSQQFQGNVTVTLSWEALNFDGNPDDLEIFWYNEATDLWVLVPSPVVDYDHGTVSIEIDHFTRYVWGSVPPPPGD